MNAEEEEEEKEVNNKGTNKQENMSIRKIMKGRITYIKEGVERIIVPCV